MLVFHLENLSAKDSEKKYTFTIKVTLISIEFLGGCAKAGYLVFRNFSLPGVPDFMTAVSGESIYRPLCTEARLCLVYSFGAPNISHVSSRWSDSHSCSIAYEFV